MDNSLPLLMLCLAGLLVILLIIYAIRFRLKRKRRWSAARQHHEPEIGSDESAPDTSAASGSNDNFDMEGIIGEVKIRYVEEAIEYKPATFKKATSASARASGLLVLHVMAAEGQAFIGYELLQSLLSAGLRFGEMNIFHRHEQPTGQGKILFSLASATEPGTFNLDEIGSLACIGLSLFMDADKVENPAKTFNLMLDTARLLAEDLGGKVFDERYQELTSDTINQYQQRITA